MKKTTRKITMATVLLCGGLLAGVGLGDMDSATAYAAEADKFFEVKSVALRVPDDNYGEGIRFTIVMDTDTYTEENVANLTTGVLLIPNYALGSDELVVDYDNAAMMKVEGVSWTADEGVMKMYVHLYNIPDTEYATEISIRAYVDDGDVTTVPLYTDVAVSSVANVADWLYRNDDLTDEEKATLQETYLTYDVFFHNGTDVTATKGIYGEKISAPTIDEMEGYTFGGWWNQAETAQWDFDNTTIGGVETNLYAKWDINTYSAKVVRADGTEETVEFTVENREEKLAAIALTANDAQYTYAWATALPSELALNNDQVFTETRTVNNYVVSFNTDGGSVVEAQTVPYGTPASALANFSSEKAGYTFVGWTFEDGSAIPEGATVTENVTVKAKWDIITYSAKVVRANGNEETVNFTVVDRAEKLAAIALTANDAQYTYTWATALPSELALNNDQVFTETKTVNNYVVSFNTDGGSVVEAQTVPYGTPASALANFSSEKAGYTFVGWTFEDGSAIPEGATVTENVTVKAKWDIITYSAKVVRANGNEETVNFTVVDRAEKLAAIALTANDAQYTYAWATALPSELALNNDQVFTETRTVNNYIITFNTDGGSAVEAQTVPYGTPASALALLTTTKTGYNFVGWTFEDGTAIPENATVQSNLTVKANWEAQRFAITFVNENGDVLQSEEVAYNTMPTCAITPVKDSDTYYNYAFAGWTPAVVAVTGEATYTATFAREIKAELKNNTYTLTELGGGEGGIGMWGNQVLTMKDCMEGTFIYKMTKGGVAGSQIHSFNLFYNGEAGSGVRITFTINGGITINEVPYAMANVIPGVEYYYLLSWKVADDYSKVTVRIRVEATGATAVEGTPVLGDFTVELNALWAAEDMESYVKANNKILIDAQQCDFAVANAWTLDDAAKFVTVKTLNDSIANLTGNESLDELNELKATFDSMDRVYQLMIKDYAALEEAIAKAKEAEEAATAAIRDNTYTLTELGGGEGGIGMWGNQVLTMKDCMEGTFIYKMTKGNVAGSQIHSFNLFYNGTPGSGIRITFTINGGITINEAPYAMANVIPGVEYYYLLSWKVADDYSKVTMRIRVEATGATAVEGTPVLGDFTVELNALWAAEDMESYVKANNKILIDAQQCDFAVANAWNEFNLEKFTVAYNVETAIANLTGDETYNELKAIKAQYDAMDRVYQLMVDNYAAFEPVYNAVVGVVIRDNTYTLTELGGGEGGIGMWGNQVLTMKDCMEGTFIYKMTKGNVAGSQIHSFNLFYDGANAGNGVRITFTINGGITINGMYYAMANVQPSVEYYYLMSWKVADDYSKVTMRIRVESTDGTTVLGDFTVELASLIGADSIESWVNTNNKILIDAQQCDFAVANAWTELDSATLEAVLDLENSIAALTGAESVETLNALKAKYDALDKVYQLMVDNYATLEAMLA